MPLLEPWLRTHRQKKFLGIYNRKVFNYFTNPYNKQGSETHNSFLVAAHIKIIQYCKDAISDVEKPPIRRNIFFQILVALVTLSYIQVLVEGCIFEKKTIYYPPYTQKEVN